jgi:hypothetical protein
MIIYHLSALVSCFLFLYFFDNLCLLFALWQLAVVNCQKSSADFCSVMFYLQHACLRRFTTSYISIYICQVHMFFFLSCSLVFGYLSSFIFSNYLLVVSSLYIIVCIFALSYFFFLFLFSFS